MNGYYISDSEIISLAENTTLGRESNLLERTPSPDKKPLIICIVLIVIAALIFQMKNFETIAGIVAIVGFGYGCYWGYKKSVFNKKLNRYQWITWMFQGVGMVFRAELQDAKDHYAHGPGNQNENIQCLKQTCTEMIVQRINNYNQACAVYNHIWALNAIVLLNDVLSSLGDNSFSVYASGSQNLIHLLNEFSMNGNVLADSSHYGKPKSSFSQSTTHTNEQLILNSINSLEAQCTNVSTSPLSIAMLDAKTILTTLYIAAYAAPPVSSDTYNRIQRLSQIAYGTAHDVLNPDAMLAHLIRCKQLSLDRANREITETRKWIDSFFKTHSNNTSFDPNQFVYSFCGALKSLQLYEIEKASLETAEKNIGVLNAELTARLDYLARGGGRKNDKVKYFSGTKRTDTLPVDYDACKMNSSDIEWLFNEVIGIKGNNACLDYALGYRVQSKKVTLPSSCIQIRGGSIANEIQRKLGTEAKISKVAVTALNSNEVLQCLKIRTSKFPYMAYLLDISQDAQQIQIRLAACWIPVANTIAQQKQQCLSLWAHGGGEETAYMDMILLAIENDIQRSIDKWITSHPPKLVDPTSSGIQTEFY